MEKLVRRHSRPVECRGEQDIEIEQGKWRDQEIRLVHITEFHRLYALSSQDEDSRQNHPKQQNECQCSEIFWHQNSPPLHPDHSVLACNPHKTAGCQRGTIPETESSGPRGDYQTKVTYRLLPFIW